MPIYKVWVYWEDPDNGNRYLIGEEPITIYGCKNKAEAHKKAFDELWENDLDRIHALCQIESERVDRVDIVRCNRCKKRLAEWDLETCGPKGN